MNDLVLIDRYIKSLVWERGLGKRTIGHYHNQCETLLCHVEGLCKTFSTVTKADCLDWIKSRHDQDAAKTSNQKIVIFRQFFDYLIQEGVIKSNPWETILYAKGHVQDIGAVMSEQVVQQLLNVINNPRDKAMFELAYASGLRVSELITLKLQDIHIKEKFVQVFGKGNVERIVPIHSDAMGFITEYIGHKRLDSVNKSSKDYLFLTTKGIHFGSQMSVPSFYKMMKRYMIKAGLPNIYSPHSIRHAFATHMVSGGADIRSVQLLLGHKDISTTAIYVHYAVDHLKDFHLKHHPRSVQIKLKPKLFALNAYP
jgi:integrase/recombinase XerD